MLLTREKRRLNFPFPRSVVREYTIQDLTLLSVRFIRVGCAEVFGCVDSYIRAIDKTRLRESAYPLSKEDMEAIDEGLRQVLVL